MELIDIGYLILAIVVFRIVTNWLKELGL